MKDRALSYLAAVLLNLALVWCGAPLTREAGDSRPGIVRLFSGARTVAASGRADGDRVWLGVLLDERMWLSLADPLSDLFPGTLRCAGLEPSVAVAN